MLALKLLSSWGHEGLVAHCNRVAAFYKAKRDMFEVVAQRHLKGVATWTTPVAGVSERTLVACPFTEQP